MAARVRSFSSIGFLRSPGKFKRGLALPTRTWPRVRAGAVSLSRWTAGMPPVTFSATPLAGNIGRRRTLGAQQSGKQIIGYLTSGPDNLASVSAAFPQGMREVGYIGC